MNFLKKLFESPAQRQLREAGQQLNEAAAWGDLRKAENLLKQNPDLVSSYAARDSLHRAAALGKKTIVELLLKNGVDINCRDYDNFTPLTSAALESSNDIIELLLSRGAEVNVQSIKLGNSPLHWIAFTDNVCGAELCLAKGADCNMKDKEGHTPLHCAAKYGNKAVAEILLKGGADVNAKNKKGETPLYIATSLNLREVAEVLRKRGGHE